MTKQTAIPPIVTIHHVKSIVRFLNRTRRPQYALYYELLAYNGIKGTALRNLKYSDVNKEQYTVLGKKVLPVTMQRLWKFCKVKGIIQTNRKLFDFTKQRAHDIWLICLEKVKLPKGTTMWDYKYGFNLYLQNVQQIPNKEKK